MLRREMRQERPRHREPSAGGGRRCALGEGSSGEEQGDRSRRRFERGGRGRSWSRREGAPARQQEPERPRRRPPRRFGWATVTPKGGRGLPSEAFIFFPPGNLSKAAGLFLQKVACDMLTFSPVLVYMAGNTFLAVNIESNKHETIFR